MARQLPKIAQDVQRLRREIEDAVRGFAQFHKYQAGGVMRQQIRAVQGLVNRAWNNPGERAAVITRLKNEIDQLKEDMQLSADVEAFQSRRQFEHLYRQAEAIGRQAGGWFNDQQHPSARNPQGNRHRGARPDTEYPRHPTTGVNA